MSLPPPKWPFPPPNNVPLVWKITSSIIIGAVGICSKIWGEWLNTTTVYNKERLVGAVGSRAAGRSLVTVCNHHSCLDDPVLWGMLPWKLLTFQCKKLRWTLSAHDVCFKKPLHTWFFSHGQSVPVVRGDGVHQQAVNYLVDKLNEGKWVHVYPEGVINSSHDPMRIKWGVGRMIADSKTNPIVIPFWHSGMDEVLPNKSPYYPQIGKEEIWKVITDSIQCEMRKLQIHCEILHHGASKYSDS